MAVVGDNMWTKVVLLAALVSHGASARLFSVDYVENVRDYEETQGRIVSGQDAYLGQIPYQTHVRAIDQQFRILGCGGSVIHESWVITAAHCTADFLQVTIRAGLIDVSYPEYVLDTWEWYNYPTYQTSNVNVQQNDISLVKLNTPITFSANVQRIKIQSTVDSLKNYAEETLIASGWGRTWTEAATPTILQWTYLRGVDDAECQRLFGSGVVSSNTICARWFNVTSQSICQGDSGGPLVQYKDGVATLVGVTSFSAGVQSGGCHSGHPGGFIRPGPFHAWFQEITGVDFESLDESTTTTPEPTTTTPTPTTTTPTPTTTTSIPTTTEQTTSGPTEPTPEPEKPDEDDDDDDDDDISELLKKLQVKVRVEINLKKYKKVGNKTKEIEHIKYLPIE